MKWRGNIREEFSLRKLVGQIAQQSINMETLLSGVNWENRLNWSDNQTLPEFTENFHRSVATWLPSAWLWSTAPLYLTYLLISPSPPRPDPGREVTKQRITAVQIFLCFLRLGLNEIWRDLWGTRLTGQGLECLSLVLVAVYVHLEKRKGFVTSGVLFIYWILVSFSHCVHLYIGIIKLEHWNLQLIIDSTCLTLCTVQLVLSCFVENLPQEPGTKPCPIGRCSFLSRITFNWVHELVKIGYQRPLTEEDLFELDEAEQSKNIVPEFEKNWKAEVKASEMSQNIKYRKRNTWRKLISSIWSVKAQTKPTIKEKENPTASLSTKTTVSLLKVLARTFGFEFVFGLVWTLLHASQNFINPVFLKLLIEFVEDPSSPNWKGYCLAGLILVTKSTSAFSHRQIHGTYSLKIGARIRAALTSAIYKKSLSMSNRARQESTVGEIVNLMSVDAEQLRELCEYLWNSAACILTFVFCLVCLYINLGIAMFAGMAVFLFVIPLNGYLMKLIEKADDDRMDEKDKRIKLMNEILNGIKVLKLYAWELAFGKKIQAIREEELRYLNRERNIDRILALSWIMIPFEVGIATFGTYLYLSDDNRLDAKTVFVTLSLFDIIRDWTSWLPWLVMDIIRSVTSLKRINKFLNHEDIDEGNVSHDNSEDDAVMIENGTFLWDAAMGACLKDINVTIAKGSLVAIVGSVGSGKSSMISAMLGEMDKTIGTVNVDGSTAYVSQQAWIQNATLKNNVLFGKPVNDSKYEAVISACALQPDLDILPAKDLTEIGEKGVNLSGGQKQRVSLARAVYFDADIYLLDDPLSAVDSHVGKHIFRQVIGNKGLLKNKTRILVTHGIKWLPHVDKIIVMNSGSVAEVGTYEELMEHDGAFAKFLKTYLTEHNSDSDSDEEVKELKSATFQRLASLESSSGNDKPNVKSKRPKICRSTSENMHEYKPGNQRLTTFAVDDTHLGLEMFNIHGKDSESYLRRRIVSTTEHQATTEDVLRRSISDPNRDYFKDKTVGEISKDTKANIIEEEEVEIGSVRLSVYISYLRALGYKSFAMMVFLFGLFEASTVAASYWLTLWTADERVHNLTEQTGVIEDRVSLNVYYLGVYAGIAVIQGIFLMCYATVHKNNWIKAAGNIHKDLLMKVLRAPMSFFDTTPTGRIVNRFSKDIENIDHGLPERLGEMTDACWTVISVSSVILYTTPALTVVILLLILLFYAQSRYYRPTSRQLQRIESRSRSPVYNHFNETLNGVSVIRAFNVQKRFEEESERRVDHNSQCKFYCNVSNSWFDIRLELAGAFVVWMATVFIVMGRGRLTGSEVGLMISKALEICFCLEWVINNVTHLENNVVSMERIDQYSNNPTEISSWLEWLICKYSHFENNLISMERIDQYRNTHAEAPLHTDKTMDTSWPHSGNIDLSDYSVRYREGLDCVLKEINVSIQSGKKVGIVGRTGAGKSSLTLSIFRLLEPAAGKITIDGEDITKLGLYDLRSRLTILPQDPVLFAGSLRMNLDPLDKHTDEDIWTALEHAHLKSFVESLPEKLKYECGEGGQNLSVGQRQLICLARSLLRKTKILVLDEATAAVDMATDELIQKTINTEFRDCTVMTIAHRLNTVLDYDMILVLDKGEIKEFDSPRILLQDKKSMFYGMAKDAGLV